MEIKITKEGNKETFSLNDLTLLELKSIYKGLNVFAEMHNNRQIKAMASTIYSYVLKDREIPLNTPADIEAMKRRDRLMMEDIKRLTPVKHTFLPTPY